MNDVIIQRENGASFESNAPVKFRHTRVSTLWELKRLIISNVGAESGRKIGNLAYRFQAITAENKLEYRPSWISEDNHVWITFEVHRRLMQDRYMEFYAEVCQVGGSSGFRLFISSMDPSPINVAAPDDVVMLDYNSIDDSDYEEESSCDSTEGDEDVRNTPIGGPRLVLPVPLPIPNLDELDLDTKHVEDPSMECAAVEYNTDGGVEFMVGHIKQNRQAVLMAVKNYSIRMNAEYRVIEYDWLKYHCRCKHHAGGCPWMIQVALQ
ncbi:hypothetical protein PIB30_030818 [Stylosanthes scabra]|uniref:Transposase MuDR plant domain-containing protein n=1 Tax=Stylosanthes scabra TaxID=79078 RepID=A0ABU6SCB1_9FABA|nr:hypothetical protein [Stylosanthes scabra]